MARNASVEHPPVGTVEASHPILDAEGRSGVEVAGKDMTIALDIVGMNALKVSEALLLVERPAGEVQPALVEVGDLPVRIGYADQDGRAVGHRAAAVFTFLQRKQCDYLLVA